MRVTHFTQHGDPGMLAPEDPPEPLPGPGQVHVDVAHARINLAEVMFRHGQITAGLQHAPGPENTATVSAAGEGATSLAPGQRAAALTLDGGGYAEQALARSGFTVPPDGPRGTIPPALAAAFPCNVTTAWGVPHGATRHAARESILIPAAAAGTGTATAQIAHLEGAGKVPGAVGSAGKRDCAHSLGDDKMAEYGSLANLVARHTGSGVDIVFDSVGGLLREEFPRHLAPLGRQVIFGGASQRGTSIPPGSLWSGCYALGGHNLGDLAHRARPGRTRANGAWDKRE